MKVEAILSSKITRVGKQHLASSVVVTKVICPVKGTSQCFSHFRRLQFTGLRRFVHNRLATFFTFYSQRDILVKVLFKTLKNANQR